MNWRGATYYILKCASILFMITNNAGKLSCWIAVFLPPKVCNMFVYGYVTQNLKGTYKIYWILLKRTDPGCVVCHCNTINIIWQQWLVETNLIYFENPLKSRQTAHFLALLRMTRWVELKPRPFLTLVDDVEVGATRRVTCVNSCHVVWRENFRDSWVWQLTWHSSWHKSGEQLKF